MSGGRNGFVVNGRTNSNTHAYVIGTLLIGTLAVASLCGCTRSEKSRFYMLDSLVQPSATASDVHTADISIGVGPIKIPEYLNRTQIAARTARYEIDYAEFDRWAETFETSIPRVLAENLSVLLSTNRVYTYPWQIKTPAYQIQVEIIQFDGKIAGNIELTARWTLLKDGLGTRITRKKFIDKRPIAGQGYSGMVSAMSLVLYDLSREIAGGVTMESPIENSVDNK